MNAPEPATTPQLSSVTRVTVAESDTVGALVPRMPMVASTPYLVAVAEMACGRLVKDLLEPGQITVGSRVVIDHLGPSKVGAWSRVPLCQFRMTLFPEWVMLMNCGPRTKVPL